MIKIAQNEDSKKVIEQLTKKYPLEVLGEKHGCVIVEVCAEGHVLDNIFKEIKGLSIKELVRTGKIAIVK